MTCPSSPSPAGSRRCDVSRRLTRIIRVFGIVQGVGFRPTVARLAERAHITGTVCNKGPYVEIVAQGTDREVESFLELLHTEPPKRASIIKVDVREAAGVADYAFFSIVESERTRGAIFISPDIATCDECAQELYDVSNRRYLHPFINCTNCGPRLTILDELPYDRVRTSMAEFPMCDACAEEYVTPTNRRYDAQPVCCNDCGPTVRILDTDLEGPAAITHARQTIASGGIVAVKGIGGFHLACDATNEDAVRLLRERKRRSRKPFAVMARGAEVAERECVVSDTARDILTGHQKPILLLPKSGTGAAAPSVAPRNPKLGIMLPYAPVQMLLFDYPDDIHVSDLLVMTSANESGAPIARDDEDARRQLGSIADAILTHNRLIRVRADDTVMDLYEDRPYMIRRSRGYAPLPQALTKPFSTDVLAIGGELKNSFCVATGELAYLSPYIGDLADVRCHDALRETIKRFLTLLEVRPQAIAADMHPAYFSRSIAEDLARDFGVDLIYVQHHFAHIVSVLAENDCEGPVVGVSFDGTGYGEDGSIWGGEILVADTTDYKRVGSIAPFPQQGGDTSSREGWRIACALLAQAYGADVAKDKALALGLAEPMEATVVCRMVEKGIGCVDSTSAGRLFDAVSALVGICRVSDYEGEAATLLQFAAEEANSAKAETLTREISEGLDLTRIETRDGAPFLVLATDELFCRLTEARLRDVDATEIAWAFHKVLANMVVEAAARGAAQEGLDTVALSGGCFQNTLLLSLVEQGLKEQGHKVLTHSLTPPNDGGIALGQAVNAARRLEKKTTQSSD